MIMITHQPYLLVTTVGRQDHQGMGPLHPQFCWTIDADDRATEFELQQLKLSVGGKMRGRDDNVKQLQKQVKSRPHCQNVSAISDSRNCYNFRFNMLRSC